MMERLLLGSGISAKAETGGRMGLCEYHMLVRRGHEECGDSAFFYCDSKQVIMGVLDGVSGEHGAASASSLAACEVLERLKGKRPTERALKEAIVHASGKIIAGFTTIALAMIDSKGSFMMASVGDSPIYSIAEDGGLDLEIPLGRPVGEGDAILKFFYFRNLVSSVLGPSGAHIEMRLRKGKLKKGEVLILASDGLTDNLYMGTKEGYIADPAGKEDLKALVGKLRNPKGIVKMLEGEVAERLMKGRVEGKGRILVPKQDDLAIIALRWL